MQFRPCIDIHNGKVKQIIGASLRDEGDYAKENYTSEHDAAYYARKYREKGIRGGHVILLNRAGSEYFEETKRQALLALRAYPRGLQAGGGIHAGNAAQYLDAGASHVIVTSYIFQNGKIRYDNLETLRREIGREHIVLDVSCRRRDGQYYIVTDRWQNDTDEIVRDETLDILGEYCSEFLVHAVDVEGKGNGIDETLVRLLGAYEKVPVTYAGGVRGYEDIRLIKKAGRGRVNVTVGSALSLFGGHMEIDRILKEITDW